MRISDWSSDVCSSDLFGDAFLLFLGGRAQQPEQQEERHHRGHEVGVGHLPGAAVMAGGAYLLDLLDDDDGGVVVARCCHGDESALCRRRQCADRVQIGRASWRERVCWYV